MLAYYDSGWVVVSFKEQRKSAVAIQGFSLGMLHAVFAVMPQETIYYEQILRAIGQGLEALSVEAFDLEVVTGMFIIEATVGVSNAAQSNASKVRSVRRAFLKICQSYKKISRSQILSGGKLSNSSALLRLKFTQTDIDNLERDGQALRSDWKGSPLAHSLPQVLRTVGWYVDRSQGRLNKISKNGGSVTVSYMGSLGTEKIETLTLLQIYDMWVHLFKQRKGCVQIG